MKKYNKLNAVILSVVSAIGLSAHAASQSQTMIRHRDGLIQTFPANALEKYNLYTPGVKDPFELKNTALLFDKRNPLPKLTYQGGNYAFFEGGVLATIDENGGFWYKGKTIYKPEAFGGNYFFNKDSHELITIDSAGYYNSTGISENAPRLLGGNFYINQVGLLTTIKHVGAEPGNPVGMVTQKNGWNFNDAIRAGGNWFEKINGTIVTIDSETGFFSDKAYTPDSLPKVIGGNYYVGNDGFLYTISNKGVLKKNMPVLGDMSIFGYSYMIANDGYFIFVDSNGNPHTEMVQVSTTGIKSEVITTIKDVLISDDGFIYTGMGL